MQMSRFGLVISVLLIVMLSRVPIQAQDTSSGQFCARAYEDSNGNAAFDAGEQVLSSGLSVNLQDGRSVTIASALMDQSPTRDRGIVCFQFLQPGQYTISISSAEYQATTSTSLTTTVEAQGAPTVMEFGARRISTIGTPAASGGSTSVLPIQLGDQEQLIRIALAVLAGLVVIAAMIVIGVLVYLVAFGRRRSVPQRDLRRTTGSLPVVPGDSQRL
jgi:hypothetical protein